MQKLTNEEWDKLDRNSKRVALINFQEPMNIYQPEKYDKRIYQAEKT